MKLEAGTAAHARNPSTRETGAGALLKSKSSFDCAAGGVEKMAGEMVQRLGALSVLLEDLSQAAQNKESSGSRR